MRIFSDAHQQKLDWTIVSVELYMFMPVLVASTYFEVYKVFLFSVCFECESAKCLLFLLVFMHCGIYLQLEGYHLL